MNDVKTEEEIDQLKHGLQNLEDTDPAYMDEEMKELRHFTMYTHLRMEESLGHLLVTHQLSPIGSATVDPVAFQKVFAGGTSIAGEVDFSRKVEMTLENGMISPEVQKDMHRVNNLRKWFSHPSKYYIKLSEIKTDRGLYKQALQDLTKAHEEMNNIFRKLPKHSPEK